jgi:hypothetical protein
MLLPQLFDDFDSVAAMLLAVNPAVGEGVSRVSSCSRTPFKHGRLRGGEGWRGKNAKQPPAK